MKILNPKNPDKPVDIDDFLKRGEYDQGDEAIIAYDDLYDYVRRPDVWATRKLKKNLEHS